MRRLGYERYGAVGNDAGSMISPELGRIAPDHVVGVHVTQLFSFPSGDPAEFAGPDRGGPGRAGHAAVVLREQVLLQPCTVQQPQTLALRARRLAGRAARLERPAVRREPRRRLRPGQRRALLAHRHRGLGDPASTTRTPTPPSAPTEPTTAPTRRWPCSPATSSPIRRFAERDHSEHRPVDDDRDRRRRPGDVGGHYAAHQATEVLVADIREFFASLR